jgi:membrane fusion protein, copper/silver efflux system
MNTRYSIQKPRAIHVALIVVGLVGGYLLAAFLAADRGHEHGMQEASMQEPAPAQASRGGVQLYTCSMHPQVRSTDPNDKCPICGMDLIPVAVDDDEHDEHGEHEAPRLRLTPRAAALMQLEVLPAERRSVQVPVRLFGRLEQDETRLLTISAWIPGRLERLHVDFTGVMVHEGEPMIELYSPRLIAAQEELLQAIRADRELENGGVGVVRESVRLMVDASRERLRLLGLAPSQIEELERRGRPDDRVTIHAPGSGVVVERLAAQGDYVDTGQPVYRLADLSTLWAQLEVYESELEWLEVGQTAIFHTQSFPGREIEGTISFIDPAISDRTRTARVRVAIPNPDGRLKPGMFVRGSVAATPAATPRPRHDDPHAGHGEGHESARATAAEPIVIPASAPLITGRRAVVYVQVPGADRPTYEPRDVLLGARAGDWYLVEEGLEEGELVVARGAFKIDSELQIRGRPSMMQPEGGRPPVHDHGGHGDSGIRDRHADHDADGAAHAAPRTFRTDLGALVNAQFEMVRALAGDDPDAARRAALSVDAALHAVDGEVLRGSAARTQWNRLAQAMHGALGELGRAPSLDRQREHFETFSDALFETVQAFGTEDTGPVYRAMCPMVQGRVGYWLQDEPVIANPYHGAAMLRCGDIIETLGDADTEGEPGS